MGMAASQARLLSITSRMSDNELRAQIINNNKMRLATESSQASERYVQALNNAKYMFSNYDSQNNISYTNLTFNSLTSYNAYNNQYALRNSGGKILISEADAKNYETSSNVNEFLAKYGLSKTTTYFENLSINEKGKVEYSYVNSDGTVVAESSGFTRDQLKAAYFGTGIDDNGSVLMIPFLPSGTKFPSSEFGYDKTLNSPEMYEYVSRLATYQNRRAEFNNLVTPTMKSTLDNMIKNHFGGSITDYATLESSVNSMNSSNANELLSKIADFFNSSTYIKKYTTEAGNTYADDAVNRLYSAAGYRTLDSSNNVEYFMGNMKFNINWSGTTPTATCQMTEDGGKTYGEAQPVTNPTSNGATPPVYTFTYKKVIATDESGNPTDEKPYTFTITKPDPTHKPKEVLIDVSLEEKVDTAKCLLEGFMGHITEFWNAFNSDFASSNADFTSARQTYVDSANELANIIYGSGAPSYSVSSIAGPPDISALDDISTMYNKQGQDSYKNFDNSFYKIYMNIVLDNIMNTYGEPKTAWINMNDQNDNGEAKAQWYTNLYNRIYQCGYSVLKDGLASSEDWIKYAFESGIVTMEQVDSYNEWNQLNYNNCSDITEQTDTRAVTIAEAEYNAAMNKIENKDKRYDLELKNIDTEHNSLQTEYDSIKAAMDKNIERTFKLYG